jgi:hypothetical protein
VLSELSPLSIARVQQKPSLAFYFLKKKQLASRAQGTTATFPPGAGLSKPPLGGLSDQALEQALPAAVMAAGAIARTISST